LNIGEPNNHLKNPKKWWMEGPRNNDTVHHSGTVLFAALVSAAAVAWLKTGPRNSTRPVSGGW